MSAKILQFTAPAPVVIRNYWSDLREILAAEIATTRPEIAAALREMNKC
jgi:hypothetical protein